LLQLFWLMRRLRPNSVSTGSTDRQLDCTEQSPQPSQTSSLMTTVLSGQVPLAAAALFGGAGLVVDDGRAALDLAELALDASSSSRWCTMPAQVVHAQVLRAIALCGHVFLGSSVTMTSLATPSAAGCS
jgi:hypothetical protein